MSHRIERVNHLIRQEVSELLRLNVKDPRLGNFIAVTDVVTSTDLKSTRIYISHFGTEEEKKDTMEAMVAASGFFRKELAKSLNLRRMPEISFHWDDSIEHGAYMEELIDKVTSEKERERNS